MKDKTVMGHMDCICCGGKGTVRVTRDKNGEPFGFCENDACFMQYRIGGRPARVATFRKRFPWAAGTQEAATAPAAQPVAAPVTAPVPKPAAPKRGGAGVFDALLGAGA